jgi:hypothetical protein
MRRLAIGSLPTAAAVAVAVAVGGCGGSSASSDQLHAQATRICALANVRAARIPTPSSPAASAAFLQRGASALAPALTGLKALHPPSDVADVYTATVQTLGQQIEALRGTAREISHGADPVRAMQQLQRRLAPLQSQENGGWQALQLSACMSH